MVEQFHTLNSEVNIEFHCWIVLYWLISIFILLLARDEGRGKNAVKDLEKEGLKPKFHLLDISSVDSIKTLSSFLKTEYGGIDILVNNAAIAYKVIYNLLLLLMIYFKLIFSTDFM